MKKIKNNYFAALVVVCIVMLMSTAPVMAQDPPDPGDPTGCWPPPCIPIDGGIGFLIAAGVAFGVKKTHDMKKKKEKE